MTGPRPREMDPDIFQALMQLLSDHPELTPATLRAAVETPAARRNRGEPIRPKTASELVALVETGIISKTEARRFLRLPRTKAR